MTGGADAAAEYRDVLARVAEVRAHAGSHEIAAIDGLASAVRGFLLRGDFERVGREDLVALVEALAETHARLADGCVRRKANALARAASLAAATALAAKWGGPAGVTATLLLAVAALVNALRTGEADRSLAALERLRGVTAELTRVLVTDASTRVRVSTGGDPTGGVAESEEPIAALRGRKGNST